MLCWTGQQFCGDGYGWVVLKPILLVSFSFGKAEGLYMLKFDSPQPPHLLFSIILPASNWVEMFADEVGLIDAAREGYKLV